MHACMHAGVRLTNTHPQQRAAMKFLPLKKKKKKPRNETHLHQLVQNHNDKKGRTTWHRFSPCDSSTTDILPPASADSSVFQDDDFHFQSPSPSTSSCSCDCDYDSSGSDRSWSMTSLLRTLPHSPSPVCSICPTSPDPFSSSAQFSTQTNKKSCNESVVIRQSASRVEIDEWMKTANELVQHNLRKTQPPIVVFMEESFNTKFPENVREAGEVDDICRDNRLLSRPKPYHAFLDEIKKQEAEAQVGASRKAAQMKFMSKLKGKETAIREWESRKTQIAITEMKKIEDELEKRRTKALEKMKNKITKAHHKANMKKVKERRSIFKKIERATEAAELDASKKCTSCLSVTRIC